VGSNNSRSQSRGRPRQPCRRHKSVPPSPSAGVVAPPTVHAECPCNLPIGQAFSPGVHEPAPASCVAPATKDSVRSKTWEGATLKIRFGTDEVRYGCRPANPGSRAKNRWTVIEKPKRCLLIGLAPWPGSVPQRREFIHGQAHWIPCHDRAEKLTANRSPLC
jgi:hypothetical protein